MIESGFFSLGGQSCFRLFVQENPMIYSSTTKFDFTPGFEAPFVNRSFKTIKSGLVAKSELNHCLSVWWHYLVSILYLYIAAHLVNSHKSSPGVVIKMPAEIAEEGNNDIDYVFEHIIAVECCCWRGGGTKEQ